MNFFEIIDTRKTNRIYEDYIPPIEDIKRIIESARIAPSACNQQNWEFIAIYNKDVKEKMAEKIQEKYSEIADKLEDEEQKKTVNGFVPHSIFFTKAPVVVACVLKKSPKFFEKILEETNSYTQEEMDKMRPDSHLLSIGGAIENMILTAHALGLGSCWMVAPVIAQKELKEILNIKEEDDLITLLTIGRPKDINGHAKKKTLEEVMRIIK